MLFEDVWNFHLFLTINRRYAVSQDVPENKDEVTIQKTDERVARGLQTSFIVCTGRT
jgi:hypothetical protein